MGLAEEWYLKEKNIKRVRAPQIDLPDDPVREFGKNYPAQGLGVVTKAWMPRRKLCVTIDDAFIESGRPLPDDFDFAFWNGAHPDLQVPWLAGNEEITLTNLCPHDMKGATRDKSGNTLLRFALLMIVAFVLEALTVRFVPAQFVAGLLGGSSPLAVPLATLVGIPLYTSNLSALGLVSGLLRQGMDRGAALAFLIGGAVTTIPAMSAVYGVVKPRVFALYLGFAVLGSLASGYAFKLAHLLW